MPDDLRFTSFPFTPSEEIPAQYTCEGADVSPALEWTHVPDGTESIALIVDDPDAPGQTFTHWVVFNLPGDATHLPRDVDLEAEFGDQEPTPQEGANDFGDVGYGGPCPPPGDGPHRYFFRLYALDTVLDLELGASKAQVTDAMNGHVLDETDLVGTYER
ncbi:MAG: YbhB/YbcL family Raf kinase inhibitor-like protein [Salinibacter sp.]